MAAHAVDGNLVHAALFGDVGQQRAAQRAGALDFAHQLLGKAQAVEDLLAPVPRAGIQQLAGGRDGVLHALLSRQKIGQQVGHEQHRVGHFQRGVAGLLHGVELEEGVELVEGDARQAEQLLPGDDLADLVGHALGARVAIVHRQAQQISVLVQQAEVHAPGVDADARDLHVHAGQLQKRLLHLIHQSGQIPDEPAAEHHGVVGEAMDLLNLHLPVFEGTQHGAAAGRAEVEAQKIQLRHNSLPFLLSARRGDCAILP